MRSWPSSVHLNLLLLTQEQDDLPPLANEMIGKHDNKLKLLPSSLWHFRERYLIV